MKLNKRASNQIGTAIIIIAIILLLGGLFIDNDYNGKIDYKNKKNQKNSNGDLDYPEDDYLFFLNETDIGRQKKVTESFPNIELGAKTENNIVYIGNNFQLKANPFSKTYYSFNLNVADIEDIENLLLYFNPNRITGKQDLKIMVNNRVYYQNTARSSEIPITVALDKTNLRNASSLKITFELDKPKWYQIFNWNTVEINELKVVEQRHPKDNNERKFSFQMDKEFLERVELNLVFECDESDLSKPIEVYINDYTIANFNPDCLSARKSVTKEVPENILKENKNDITFKTKGFYKLAYSLNKIYFNDKEEYKFTINSFNDIIDVVMYGDFDKPIMDVKINDQLIALEKNDLVSVLPYLKFGTNEVEIMTKPIGIEEFVIEKNEFIYD